MRILFVVQRYGVSIAGGAEQHCRRLAETLVDRGHEVHVATTCAVDYVTWANSFPDGTERINGVVVHRFPVSQPRNKELFDSISRTIDFVDGHNTVEQERIWLDAQGPLVTGLRDWLATEGRRFDIAVVFTYLYSTAEIALEELDGHIPVLLRATAHREPPMNLGLIRRRLASVRHFLCATPEEESLLREYGSPTARYDVVGIGVDEVVVRSASLSDTMRRLQIPLHRYALVLGRVDGSKGVLEGIDHFREFKRSTETSLRLVVVGANVENLRSDSDVSLTGYVDPDDAGALIAGAEVLIQPSYFESFSLAICEAWLAQVPSLANAHCDVLAGQSQRSGGGLLYTDVQSFVAQLQSLDRDAKLRRSLGIKGRQFVLDQYRPDVVADQFERVLVDAITKR